MCNMIKNSGTLTKEELRQKYYDAIDGLRKELMNFQEVASINLKEDGNDFVSETFNRLFEIIEENSNMCKFPVDMELDDLLFRLDNWLMALKIVVQKYL